MTFKLARHFAERTAQRQLSASEATAPLGDRRLASIAVGDLTGGIAFSEIPGFAGAPVPSAAATPNDASAEQLKVQQDTYALMTGAGINVVVKNFDQQSRFG